MYNMTNLTASTNAFDVAKFANEVTGGLFFTLTILALFIILLLILKKWSFEVALMSSTFICTVLSMIGWAGGFLNTKIMLSFVVAFIGCALYIFIVSRD
jgi:hypothetical protein